MQLFIRDASGKEQIVYTFNDDYVQLFAIGRQLFMELGHGGTNQENEEIWLKNVAKEMGFDLIKRRRKRNDLSNHIEKLTQLLKENENSLNNSTD